ncbi:MAG: MBL fold metallo-hydrolase [Rhizobiaceae bacterium]|nr:MAG: MBL fold metallo-hydrolase [Rhizobiaceae bacterium]
MSTTRRDTLKFGAAFGVAMVAAPTALWAAPARHPDVYKTAHGEITIQPIQHASFVMTIPGMVIYNDPIGEAALYAGEPAPDLILITHEHTDHYDPKTLAALVRPGTKLVTSRVVYGLLPPDLKARAMALGNGGTTTVNGLKIEAVPAYNTTPARLKYHPKGRGNGYVLSVDRKRVYIAGDTEDIPSMRAMEDIFIAFVPMNLPYTMTVDQAASAVAAFHPSYVYPYHYRGSDPKAFARTLAATGSKTKVVFGPWY